MKLKDVDRAREAIHDAMDYFSEEPGETYRGLKTALTIVTKVREKLNGSDRKRVDKRS